MILSVRARTSDPYVFCRRTRLLIFAKNKIKCFYFLPGTGSTGRVRFGTRRNREFSSRAISGSRASRKNRVGAFRKFTGSGRVGRRKIRPRPTARPQWFLFFLRVIHVPIGTRTNNPRTSPVVSAGGSGRTTLPCGGRHERTDELNSWNGQTQNVF